MMETKELFDWVLKQPCFEVFDFLYLNGLDFKETLEVCVTKTWFSYAENILHAVLEQVRHI